MTAGVYVLLDVLGRELYVGSTSSLDRRLAEHRRGADWASHIASVEWYPQPDRAVALHVERNLIRLLRPEFNRQSNTAPRSLGDRLNHASVREIFEQVSA